MKRIAHMLFAIETDQPFRKSSGIINHYIRQALESFDFQVYEFNRDSRLELPHAEQLIPLADVSLLHQVSLVPEPAVTFYDDLGLSIRAPVSRVDHRNFLFFHGLRGNPGMISANLAVDLYCTNSAYTRRILRSFMLFPDWRRRRVLDVRGAAATTSVRLPVPLIDYPDGYPSTGEDLPLEVVKAFRSGAVLGHSVQRKKASPNAILHIMGELNAFADADGAPGYQLVITRDLWSELKVVLENHSVADRDRAARWFLVVPLLKNTAMVSLMKSCRFGLCYNRIPDSFGLYPLESVWLGCPVYTNGIGNYRWLLPAGHGIYIHETEEMAFGDLMHFKDVARRIHTDVGNPPEAACALGRAYIAENHNRTCFNLDFRHAVEQLDGEAHRIEFDELTFELSPVVRSWNPKTRRVVSDHRNLVLELESADIIENVIGRTTASVTDRDVRIEKLTALFHTGVLALRPKWEEKLDRGGC
jgi:hypothetical protein